MHDALRVAGMVALGVVAGAIVGAIVHEGAHVMLYNRFGCTSSLIVPLRPGLWVGIQPSCPPETADVAARANLMAEAVGYHVYLLCAVVGGIIGGRRAQ